MLLNSIIKTFDGISLSEMEAVKLMNRTDQKYWFNRNLLSALLADVAQDYYILEIDGERNLPYSTIYYDTEHDGMYENHHRGKMNRYKIRRRNYVSTGSSFLEIKFKSNKGRTIKVRRASDYNNTGFNEKDQSFIAKNSPYTCDELRRVLENGFRRLMLVSKSMNERCTIDSELKFTSAEGVSSLDNLVIVEVKRDGRTPSAIVDALNRMRLKPSGLSKYCMGRSLTDKELKQNNFKIKHRTIFKRMYNTINSVNL